MNRILHSLVQFRQTPKHRTVSFYFPNSAPPPVLRSFPSITSHPIGVILITNAHWKILEILASFCDKCQSQHTIIIHLCQGAAILDGAYMIPLQIIESQHELPRWTKFLMYEQLPLHINLSPTWLPSESCVICCPLSLLPQRASYRNI